ncbi:lipoprotein-anchoring transpeptidase ErfK/SrfK [Bradyrhizobium sp. USDA 4523]
MFRKTTLALLAGASSLIAVPHHAMAIDAAAPAGPAVIYANQGAPQPPMRTAYVQPQRSNMGGGFIEFLFGDAPSSQGYSPQPYQQQPGYYGNRQLPPMDPQQQMLRQQEEAAGDPAQRPFDPRYEKQLVDYSGKESAGTIVVDTPNKFLYLVQGDGRALRYGIGVGRPGFTWAGVKTISAKKEWPALDAAAGNAGAPSRSAAAHGRRPGKSARRPRDVSRLLALPHPRLQRALDDRHQRLVRLHPDAQ